MLHDCDSVSAIVQIVVLPPCWASLQSLNLLCVCRSNIKKTLRECVCNLVDKSYPSVTGFAASGPRPPLGPACIHSWAKILFWRPRILMIPKDKTNLRHVSVLQGCVSPSALVQIAVFPPYLASLQSLDLLCVWITNSLENRAQVISTKCQSKQWFTPPPHVWLQLFQEPQDAQVASTAGIKWKEWK